MVDILKAVEIRIAEIFFPSADYNGGQLRKLGKMQKRYLNEFAPEIDIDEFFHESPILNWIKRTPKWAINIPFAIRPNLSHCARLEAIRKKHNIQTDYFEGYILGHPCTTRKLLKLEYLNCFTSNPNYPVENALYHIIDYRVSLIAEAGQRMNIFGLDELRDDQISYDARVRSIVLRYSTIDDLIDAIIEEEDNGISYRPEREGVESFKKIWNVLLEGL